MKIDSLSHSKTASESHERESSARGQFIRDLVAAAGANGPGATDARVASTPTPTPTPAKR